MRRTLIGSTPDQGQKKCTAGPDPVKLEGNPPDLFLPKLPRWNLLDMKDYLVLFQFVVYFQAFLFPGFSMLM